MHKSTSHCIINLVLEQTGELGSSLNLHAIYNLIQNVTVHLYSYQENDLCEIQYTTVQYKKDSGYKSLVDHEYNNNYTTYTLT